MRVWKEYKNNVFDYFSWLYMEEEFKYIQKNGVDALEKQFEEKEINIYNIYRKSII